MQDIENNLIKVIQRRRSVRQFGNNDISKQDLLTIIRAGIYAPSGSNAQNQRFILIQDEKELHRVGEMRWVWPYPTAKKIRTKKKSGLIGGAKAAIIVLSDSRHTNPRNTGEYFVWETLEVQNSSASIQNMLLMATAMGIGSCWLSAGQIMSGTRSLSGKNWAEILCHYDVSIYHKVQGIVILGYAKRNDDEGFPLGEREHGAQIWDDVSRSGVENYMLLPNDRGVTKISPPIIVGWLKFLSFIQTTFIKMNRLLDRLIFYTEMRGISEKDVRKLRPRNLGKK
jgi:nitroreductase